MKCITACEVHDQRTPPRPTPIPTLTPPSYPIPRCERRLVAYFNKRRKKESHEAHEAREHTSTSTRVRARTHEEEDDDDDEENDAAEL